MIYAYAILKREGGGRGEGGRNKGNMRITICMYDCFCVRECVYMCASVHVSMSVYVG